MRQHADVNSNEVALPDKPAEDAKNHNPALLTDDPPEDVKPGETEVRTNGRRALGLKGKRRSPYDGTAHRQAPGIHP